SDGHELPLPALSGEFTAEDCRRVYLDKDLPFEIAAGIEIEVDVIPPRDTVHTLVLASPVWVDRPAKRHLFRHGSSQQTRPLDLDDLSLWVTRHRRTSSRPTIQTRVRLKDRIKENVARVKVLRQATSSRMLTDAASPAIPAAWRRLGRGRRSH